MSTENQLKLVFIPFPIMSHHVSAVETAKLLVDKDECLSITILVMKLPIYTKIHSHTNNSPDSRINFVQVPQNLSNVSELIKSPKTFVNRFLESQRDPVKEVVAEIMKSSSSSRVAGFVVDMFCTTTMNDVGNELGIPTYLYFPCSAAMLGLMLHVQSRRDDYNDDVTEYVHDLDAEILVPSYVNPFPVRVLPSPIFDKDIDFINLARRFRETKGILINTFPEFEPHAISSLTAGGERIPPIYPIGPILQGNQESDKNIEKAQEDEIINWLNEQPNSSVVFLCFGSVGCFDEDQVKEIATALEKSGHRFLWSLRKEAKMEYPGEYENLNQVLPEGFLQRTADMGRIIGWAPQMEVLSHTATGGFVSHCGWNSILESVWCGVPMAVWPLAAEQQSNAFLLVKEFEMAVEIQMDYRKKSGGGGIVGAEKIENAIRNLMDLGNPIRIKVHGMKEKSRMAVVEGGSSSDYLGRLLDDINININGKLSN